MCILFWGSLVAFSVAREPDCSAGARRCFSGDPMLDWWWDFLGRLSNVKGRVCALHQAACESPFQRGVFLMLNQLRFSHLSYWLAFLTAVNGRTAQRS